MKDKALSDLFLEMLREECNRCEKLAADSPAHEIAFRVLDKLLQDMKQVQKKARRYA